MLAERELPFKFQVPEEGAQHPSPASQAGFRHLVEDRHPWLLAQPCTGSQY